MPDLNPKCLHTQRSLWLWQDFTLFSLPWFQMFTFYSCCLSEHCNKVWVSLSPCNNGNNSNNERKGQEEILIFKNVVLCFLTIVLIYEDNWNFKSETLNLFFLLFSVKTTKMTVIECLEYYYKSMTNTSKSKKFMWQSVVCNWLF